MAVSASQIQQLYIAYYGRPADPAGLAYWQAQAAAGTARGTTDAAILDSFGASFGANAEYTATFANMSDVQKVNTVYNNLFSHDADPSGLLYWATKLTNGDLTIANIVRAVSTSAITAKNVDGVAFNSKVTAAESFTNSLTTTTQILGYTGTAAGVAAKAWITTINSADTLATAIAPTALAATVASATAAPVVAGQTFTLTTGLDTSAFVGGSNNDAFNATVVQTNTTGTTLQAGDALTGGAGTDTLTVSVTGAAAAAGTTTPVSAVSLTGVEKVLVNNFNTQVMTAGVAATTFDGALFDSSLTTLGLAASSTTANAGNTAFTNIKKIVAGEMGQGVGDLTIGYLGTVVAGTADAMSLSLANQTGGTFTASGIETLNVASNTSANTVTLAAGPTTVNVSGAVKLTLGGTLDSGVTTLNASANTGGLVVVHATAGIAITGSAAADTITSGTNLTGVGAVDAGAGVDALVTTANTAIAATTDGTRYTNFETLSINETGVDVNNGRAQDVSLVAGITKIALSAFNDTTDDANEGGATVAFTKLSSAVTALDISGIANADNVDMIVNLTAARTTDTTTDTLALTMGTTTASMGTDTVAATGGVDEMIDITINDEETVSILSQGGTNLVRQINAADLTSLTITGSKALTIATLAGNTALTTINASAATANVIISANAGTTASTITGGAGNDAFIGSTKADSIDGGSGNDSLSGGAGVDIIVGGAGLDSIVGGAGIDSLSGGDGNDTFEVGATQTDFTGSATAETVSGGAGTDTLSFAAAAYTITAAELLGLSSIEQITIGATTDATAITLTDAVFTANGNASLIIDLDAATTSNVTITASALTAANSLNVIYTAANEDTAGSSISLGAGADTVRVDALMLDDVATIGGGTGSDILNIGADGTATMNANITGFESMTFRTVTGAYAITADNATAASTFTVDASNLTSGTLLFSAAAETASAYVMTGGGGVDTLTGGAGNDTISGGLGADTIVGGAGVDNLSGGEGGDLFTVATVAHFVGLTAAEVVAGGTGADILDFTENAATVISVADLAGISSIETIRLTGNTTNTITLADSTFTANGAATLTITDSQATAGMTVNGSAITSSANSLVINGTVAATGVNDTLTGGSGNDTFNYATSGTIGVSFEATDVINGGAGVDTLALTITTTALTAVTLTNVSNIEKITLANTAGTLDTSITLADANFATVTGATIDFSGSTTTGTGTIDASAEDDSTFVITGSTGADTITGGQLADTISGGAGIDRITGHAGADQLTGGAAADTFVYTNATVAHSSGTVVDSITDFLSGTDKLEVTLNYSSLTSVLNINAVRASAGVAGLTLAQDALSGERGQYIYDTTTSQLYINVNADNLITSSDFKIGTNAGTTASATFAADGSDINFVITGGTNADVIIAGGGADTITSGGGADSIDAGAGADTITSTAGGTIIGGLGADSITMNGAGDHVIRFTSAASFDTITNTSGWATGGADKIQISMAGISVGDGNTTIANGATGDGNTVGSTAELYVVQTNSADITLANVVSAVGPAGITNLALSANVAAGAKIILAFDDGTDTAVYLFTSAAADTTILAAELTLIGFLTGVAATAHGDYVFVA